MIMRFRPANIRLINRRSNLPRPLLTLSSKEETNNDNDNDKNNPTHVQPLTGSLHIRDGVSLGNEVASFATVGAATNLHQSRIAAAKDALERHG
jgi:hypothetical protein